MYQALSRRLSCIFQDSPEDWANESSRMREVYRRAIFTIAATAAYDGRTGLFFERQHPRMSLVQVDITWPVETHPPGENAFHVKPGSYFIGDASGYVEDIDRAPLNTRAWVAQERYLSPRIMHFSSALLYWECAEVFASELHPERIPAPLVNTHTTAPLKACSLVVSKTNPVCKVGSPAEPGLVPSLDMVRHIYDCWIKFRFKYTECKRTCDRDLLVALIGVATDVNDMFLKCDSPQHENGKTSGLSTSFIAGMWRQYLLVELCWHTVNHDEQLSDRPASWRAPTWSWVSNNQPIDGSKCQTFFSILSSMDAIELARNWNPDAILSDPDNWDPSTYKMRQSAEILDVQVETTPSGEVRSGFLRLRCRPFATTSHTSVNGRFGAFDSPHFLRQDFVSAKFCIRYDCAMREAEVDALAVMLVYTIDDDTNCELCIEGILLKPSIAQPDTFERIGYFYTCDDKDTNVPTHWIWLQHEAAEDQVITII